MAVSRHDDWLVKEVQQLSDPFQAIRECFSTTEIEEIAEYHPVHRAMLAWSKTVLPNVVIAAISDGAEMAHRVDSRPPFLDHVVAEFSHTLSVDMLIHLEPDQPPVEKWIFARQSVPPFRWELGGPLYIKLSSLITRENVERLGFVDWSKCEDLVERTFDGKDQLLYRQAIWLAQIISMGMQFSVQRWRPERVAEEGVSRPAEGRVRSVSKERLGG
ncbi:hypothetical protein LTR85_008860 [Meristemomyces frigidus]|nr:hypothetical protein LTR85_008860 [Meristemomyces frigidus]